MQNFQRLNLEILHLVLKMLVHGQDYRLYFEEHFLGVGYFNVLQDQTFLHPRRLISELSTLIV